MAQSHHNKIEDMCPEDVWDQLNTNSDAALVDCRTDREWSVIGAPDLSTLNKDTVFVEWRSGPAMTVNDSFATQLDDAFAGDYPETLLFICRSGARSKEAATYMQEILSSKSIKCTCVNVAEGFEGTQTPEMIAAGTTGWRNKQLPWTHKS